MFINFFAKSQIRNALLRHTLPIVPFLTVRKQLRIPGKQVGMTVPKNLFEKQQDVVHGLC